MFYYNDKCDDCSMFLKEYKKSFYSDNCYCEWYRTYYPPESDACSHFSRRETENGGCYITTIIHEVLEKPDNCKVLNNLREFRDNVLQASEQYKYLLYEYDTVGPLIATKIKKENDVDFCKDLYNKCLKPISNMIDKKEYLSAIVNYQNLVSKLSIIYGIDNNFEILENYDMKLGGHGKKLVLS